MQNELVYPNNGDCLGSSIASSPFVPPERRALSPLYPNNDVDLPYPYSIFSPQEVTPSLVTPPLSASGSVSISPSSVSFDEMEDATAAADNRLYLARLALQYQEIAERYDMCLSNLRDAEEEAESLRRENASLRAANGELARRLGLLAGKHAGSVPSSAAFALADELSRLSIAKQPPPKESPTSVLAFQEGSGGSHRFARQSAAEKRVTLPKSISVRSSGYLKLNPTSEGGPTAKRNGRFRASSPVMGGSQRVYVGGASSNKKGERGEDEEKEGGAGGLGGGGALEVEVYHQGMFKTELCNKWEESGVCPYGDQCQFAHGIAELRPVLRHPRYKTELCRMVLFGDSCPYGHRCHFRHSLSPSDHQRLLLRP